MSLLNPLSPLKPRLAALNPPQQTLSAFASIICSLTAARRTDIACIDFQLFTDWRTKRWVTRERDTVLPLPFMANVPFDVVLSHVQNQFPEAHNVFSYEDKLGGHTWVRVIF